MRIAFLAWVMVVVACGQRREPAARPRPDGPLLVVPAPPEKPLAPDDAVYLRACPLSGHKAGKVKIESDHRVSFIDGARTVATGETDDDFHAPRVEVSCARRSITLQLETDTEFRDVTLRLERRELVETSTAHQRR